MTSIRVTICHNDTSRFLPYQPADALTPVYTLTAELPDDYTAVQVAEWAFGLLNADLEMLEPGSADDYGLLHACMYRLLRLRSMSVGDVIGIDSGGARLWMACDLVGWSTVTAPRHLGDGLSLASRVSQMLLPEVSR